MTASRTAGQGEAVRWAELKPEEFLRRLAERPVAYLPMGMVEPHGHAAAFGLDQIKAEYLCDEAAARFGGIVAPPQTYHIHETGFHGTWLEEVVGEVNPRLGGLPPDVVMRSLLFQLRVCVNAGFRAVMVVSGQNGAQGDLRLVADEFMKLVPVPVVIRSDPELVRGTFPGDHAGRYELSQLLYIRPDLVDMSRLDRVSSDPLAGSRRTPTRTKPPHSMASRSSRRRSRGSASSSTKPASAHPTCRPSHSTTSSLRGPRSSGSDRRGLATARSPADVITRGGLASFR